METAVLVLSNVMIVAIIIMFAARNREAIFHLRKLKRKRRANVKMNVTMISEYIDKDVIVRDAINGSTFDGKLVRVEENWIKVERQTRKGVVSRLINLDSVESIEVR